MDIDEDILHAARERARRENQTMGQVISALARRGLTATGEPLAFGEPKTLYGFTPLPKRGGIVSNEIIGRLREDDAY